MNKKAVIPMIALSAALAVTGCASSSGETGSKSSVTATTDSATSLSNVKKSVENDKPREFKEPDVYGQVKGVVGNEVTIMLAEKPKAPANGGEKPSTTGSSSQRPSVKRTLKLTGETKTVTLPVGVPIEKMARGGGENLDISQISEGDVISVYYVDSDASKGVVEKVGIRSASGGSSQNGQPN